MSDVSEQEDSFRTQVLKVAETLGLGRVPAKLEDYGGWFVEARKRVDMRSQWRTRNEALALLQQASTAHDELLKLKRTQAELARLDKENAVKDLELDEKEQELRVKIEKHKQALKNLADPPQQRRSSRSILHEEDDDE